MLICYSFSFKILKFLRLIFFLIKLLLNDKNLKSKLYWKTSLKSDDYCVFTCSGLFLNVD